MQPSGRPMQKGGKVELKTEKEIYNIKFGVVWAVKCACAFWQHMRAWETWLTPWDIAHRMICGEHGKNYGEWDSLRVCGLWSEGAEVRVLQSMHNAHTAHVTTPLPHIAHTPFGRQNCRLHCVCGAKSHRINTKWRTYLSFDSIVIHIHIESLLSVLLETPIID